MESKIALLVIMSLITLGAVFAADTQWALVEDRFGNVQTIKGDYELINMSDTDSMTMCIPFKTSSSGVMDEIGFEFQALNNPIFSYCISTDLVHPEDGCDYGDFNLSAVYTQPLSTAAIPILANTNYYFCIQSISGGDIMVATTTTNNETYPFLEFYYDTIQNVNLSRQFHSEVVGVYDSTWNVRVDYKIAGVWSGWTELDNQVRNFQFELGSGERYIVSGQGYDETDISLCSYQGTAGQLRPLYQRFYWEYDTNRLERIDMILRRSPTTGATFKYEIYANNSLIFQSGGISLATLSNTFSKVSYLLPSPIYLHPNTNYYIGIVCTSGCNQPMVGIYQNFVCAKMNRYEDSGWFAAGFQDRTGYVERTPTTDLVEYDMWFYLTMQDDISYSSSQTFQCSDALDNDNDGFTDYPSDPACSSATDNTEAPINVYACNDGYDNDLDGFFDLDDPQCASVFDNDEFPKDGTIQGEDACYPDEGCLIYDTIPYSDDPFLHGWYDFVGVSNPEVGIAQYLGGYSILLDTEGMFYEQAAILKNVTHTNIYQGLEGQISISITPIGGINYADQEAIYLGYFDENEDEVAILKLNVTTIPAQVPDPYNVKIEIFAKDDTDWVYVGDAFTQNTDSGFLRFYFTMDEFNEEYNITWQDSTGKHKGSSSYAYSSDTTTAIVDKVGIINEMYSSNTRVLLNLAELYGYFPSSTTICDDWTSPYYLKESFNGYLDECGWVTSHNIQCLGNLKLYGSIEDYQIYRSFSEIAKESNNRYTTIEFDLNMMDINTGNTFTIRLYDPDDYNFLTIWFRDSGDYLWYNDNGAGKQATAITLGTTLHYKLVVDMQSDTFDIYVDGSLVKQNAGFANALYNLEEMQYIKITADQVTATMDNLLIFASDDAGIKITPDDKPPVTPADATLKFCGLITTETPSCTSDSDCETGKCEVTKKCSSFDYTYCDENSWVRGNGCVIKGFRDCGLSSAGNWIIDNILYFIILLILMIGASYFIVVWRR